MAVVIVKVVSYNGFAKGILIQRIAQTGRTKSVGQDFVGRPI